MSLTIEMKCKKHPKYKAERQPGTACQGCWDIWEERPRHEDAHYAMEGSYSLTINGKPIEYDSFRRPTK